MKMGQKTICWVLQEDGTVKPAVGLGLMMFGTARAVYENGEFEVTDRKNLLDPNDLDKRFDYAAWLLEDA